MSHGQQHPGGGFAPQQPGQGFAPPQQPGQGFAPPQQGAGFQPQGQAGGFGQPNGGYGGQPGGFGGQAPAGGFQQAGGEVFGQWANTPMVGMGLNAASSALTSGMGRYMPGLSLFWRSLKYYFAVNNSYVRNKLQILFFPFTKKEWKRLTLDEAGGGMGGGGGGGGQGQEFSHEASSKHALPYADVNAPDLYLPLMGFVTYVLVTAFVKGTSGSFTPEAMSDIGTSCLLAQAVELACFRAALYSIQASVPALDLVAYTGYMYLGLCVNMVAGLLLGMWAYYLCLLWTGGAISFFVCKTMAQAVPEIIGSGHNRRGLIVYGLAGLQFVAIWWLGYARDLSG